jgi:2-hydroxy-3-keto-5-methylthiopentenyl-1-phosphate phosphatase
MAIVPPGSPSDCLAAIRAIRQGPPGTIDRMPGRAPSLDLGVTSVFLDFDGTISQGDVGVHLLARLGTPGWEQIDAEYDAGEIGSRVCLLEEWDLLPKDAGLLRRVAAEIPLDPDLDPLVAGLRDAGAEVTVVSDGFGFYAAEECGHLGIPILTNTVDWATGRLEFPNADRCCACSSCGTCKQAPIKDARHRGRTTVMVGDGTSDRKAALVADVIFAKGPLARWCAGNRVSFIPFETLGEVRATLLP